MSVRNRLFDLSSMRAGLSAGAAVGVAGLASGAFAAAPGLDDVQIGERGDRTRIALVCEAECSLVKHSDKDFLLRGANADLSLDLGDHSVNVAGLTAIAAGGGSLVQVSLAREIDHAEAGACVVGGHRGACIDLFFKPLPPAPVTTPDVAVSSADRASRGAPARDPDPAPAMRDAPRQASVKAALNAAPSIREGAAPHGRDPVSKEPAPQTPVLREPAGAAAPVAPAFVAPAPGLRDGGSAQRFRFAGAASPERLAPHAFSGDSLSGNAPAPAQGAVLAKLQPATAAAPAYAPRAFDGGAVRLKPETGVGPGSDPSLQISAILGKDLSPEYCAQARAILNADPWALDAMGDIGLCALAAGDAEEAEAILSRLLEYTPDHYEAHVGRAIIAAQAGERSVARRYFQDALNALPPIGESDRIVAAMNAL